MDRRRFLALAAAALAAPRISSAVVEGASLDRIGLVLWTVRTLMPEDFEGTLAKVAKIGYEEVEFAGYFGRTPAQVREVLKRYGLKSPSGHVSTPQLYGEWEQVLSDFEAMGHRYAVYGGLGFPRPSERSLEDWKRHAQFFNEAGKTSRNRGIQFVYHNHHFEFEPVTAEGKLAYEVLLEETDPELVQLELDLYWITRGEQDAVPWLSRYPSRFYAVHIKDMADPETKAMADVGRGFIDFKRILRTARQGGLKHYFVERDDPPEPIASARASYDYLRQLRF